MEQKRHKVLRNLVSKKLNLILILLIFLFFAATVFYTVLKLLGIAGLIYESDSAFR